MLYQNRYDLDGFAAGRLSGSRGVFPRFRSLDSRHGPRYVYAAPFKRARHWLVIVPGTCFGTMTDAAFRLDYTPSNQDARETVTMVEKRWSRLDA